MSRFDGPDKEEKSWWERRAEYKLRQRRKPWETLEERRQTEEVQARAVMGCIVVVAIFVVIFVVAGGFSRSGKRAAEEQERQERLAPLREEVLAYTDIEEGKPFVYPGGELPEDYEFMLDEFDFTCEPVASYHPRDAPPDEQVYGFRCASIFEPRKPPV